jgi:3-dehydroquinate dehydratase II
MGIDRDSTSDVIPTVTLAKVYERQGLLDEAADVYRKLVALEPERSDLDEALKDIEERLKEEGGAALESEPEIVLTRLERWQQGIKGRKRVTGKRPEKEIRVMVIQASKEDTVGEPVQSFSGGLTLEEIDGEVKEAAKACGMVAETFQSNDERQLVRKIEEASEGIDALIISPAEYAHTSTATRDALLGLDIPIIEVHLSNAHGKGSLGQGSLTADVVTAHLAGFGKNGYAMAVKAAANMTRKASRPREGA